MGDPKFDELNNEAELEDDAEERKRVLELPKQEPKNEKAEVEAEILELAGRLKGKLEDLSSNLLSDVEIDRMRRVRSYMNELETELDIVFE